MLGKIVYISDTMAHIKIPEGTKLSMNIMNMHMIFEDKDRKVLGEVADISTDTIKISFLGELDNGKFVSGVLRKPSLDANVRIINNEEVQLLLGTASQSTFNIGHSPLYNGLPIYIDINDLFSNHMAIFGNTGSGKSYGVSRLIQSLFYNPNFIPFKSNILIFDAYGEYHNAFMRLNEVNPNYNFKYYTTNKSDTNGELLKIPVWLLGVDDYALLLGADSHGQLQIIEKAIKFVKIFCSNDEVAISYRNHLVAKAVMNVLYTNQTSSSKRNDIFTIVNNCSTDAFNLEAPVQGIGYTRKFRECFDINKDGNFVESVLITEYISNFIDDKLDKYEPKEDVFYTLTDFEKAFDFTMISDGLLRNERTYGQAVTLKARLHSLLISENAQYFMYPNFIDRANYVASLVTTKEGKKAQIVNINLEDLEDRLAKTIVKIYSKILFDFTKTLPDRASIPFHILLEESHRYVQADDDVYLLGYNIFERIAKEGRKFGLVLDLVSQRPVELSETVISQCSNFLIFKMTHPRDLDYIKKMLPNISSDVIEKQKSLQPGTCVAFGKAFKIPMIIRLPLPNPEPQSSNADIVKRWTS